MTGRPPLVLTGPTGSGKSAVAVELALRLDGTVVCADSRQLYRGLDVATGKPTALERGRAPHAGFDRLEPTEPSSAGDYARFTGALLQELAAGQRLALLTGGTGLYLRALHAGLAEVPPVPEEVRRAVRAQVEAEGPVVAHERLATLDPPLAARLSPQDRQRIARGLEVVLGTGRPLSAYHSDSARDPVPWFWVALVRPRAEQVEALAERARGFFAAGLVEEVAAWMARGVPRDAPGFDALGYREACDVVTGRIDRAEAIGSLVRHTLQYAKRQATWLRGEARRVEIVFREVGRHESPGQVAQDLAGQYRRFAERTGAS